MDRNDRTLNAGPKPATGASPRPVDTDAPTTVGRRQVVWVVLTVGPLLWAAVTAQVASSANGLFLGLIFTALLWLPATPVSIPALLTQDVRDAALPGVPAPLRALLLIPWLAAHPDSPVRALTLGNLAAGAVAVGLLVHAGALAQLTSTSLSISG